MRKKCFLISFQGQSRSLGFITFFVSTLAIMLPKYCENMKMNNKDMPIYVLNLTIWTHLAPQ